MNLLVSVVILSWNRCDELEQTLEIVTNYDYVPLEVIVVDNGSSDGTGDMIHSRFPTVRLLELQKNIGIAGFNRGFEIAFSEYIFVLDDDSFPATRSISAAVQKFRENPKLGIAAFKIVNYYSGLSNQTDEYEKGRYADPTKGIPAKRFVGCGAMIKRKLLDIVGYYPEDFFLYGNEADLALRTISEGFEVRYFPDLVAIHKIADRNRSSARSMYFGTRNTLWLFWKYSSLPCAFLKTIFLILKSGVLSLTSGTFGSFIKGFLDGIVRLPDKLRSRRIVQTQTLRAMLRNRY